MIDYSISDITITFSKVDYNYRGEIQNCENCKGLITRCKFCGAKIEILNGNVTNFGEGTIHRCIGAGRKRRY